MREKDYQNYPKSLSLGAEDKIKSHTVQILNQFVFTPSVNFLQTNLKNIKGR